MEILGITITPSLVLGVVLGLILLCTFSCKCSGRKQIGGGDEESTSSSLQTEYSKAESTEGNFVDTRRPDGSKCHDQGLSLYTTSEEPEPLVEEPHLSLGRATMSEQIPQVWDSQGKNLIRGCDGCDRYV